MLKRRLITAGAALAISLSMFDGVMADPPGVAWDANENNSANSKNCIAYYSAPHRHNGQAGSLGQGGDPSHGTRGDEIKGLQATCNLASE